VLQRAASSCTGSALMTRRGLSTGAAQMASAARRAGVVTPCFAAACCALGTLLLGAPAAGDMPALCDCVQPNPGRQAVCWDERTQKNRYRAVCTGYATRPGCEAVSDHGWIPAGFCRWREASPTTTSTATTTVTAGAHCTNSRGCTERHAPLCYSSSLFSHSVQVACPT